MIGTIKNVLELSGASAAGFTYFISHITRYRLDICTYRLQALGLCIVVQAVTIYPAFDEPIASLKFIQSHPTLATGSTCIFRYGSLDPRSMDNLPMKIIGFSGFDLTLTENSLPVDALVLELSPCTWESHPTLLEDMSEAPTAAGLTLKPSTVQFGPKEVEYLGPHQTVSKLKTTA